MTPPAVRRRFAGLLAPIAGLAGMVALCTGAHAQDTLRSEVALAPLDTAAAVASRVEGRSTSWTPEVSAARLSGGLPGPQAIGPDGRVLDEMVGVRAMLWRWRGRTALGVGLGTLGYVRGAPDAPGHVTLGALAPTVALGMRYRMSADSVVFADASGARAIPPDAGGYVSGKVGLEWKPSTSRFGIDGGRFGVQLDSGYRLSFKARRDGLGVYLRGNF